MRNGKKATVGPHQRVLQLVDRETGEVMEGVPYIKAKKIPHPYGTRWVQMQQNALLMIASDKTLTGENLRVFMYLSSRLDFENYIPITQQEVAEALSLDKSNVSKSFKALLDRRIIKRGPRLADGKSFTWLLNPHVGWKGSAKTARASMAKEQEPDLPLLRVIEGGKPQD